MPALLKLIQDSQTTLWVIYFAPDEGAATLGSEENAVSFATDEGRQSVLDILNQSIADRYIAQDRPPIKPPNP